MRMGGALFVRGILARLSPDSARTKNTIANIIASQNVSRTTAFNRFMILFFLLRASVPEFSFDSDRTAADALRFGAGNTAQEPPRKARKIFSLKGSENDFLPQKK